MSLSEKDLLVITSQEEELWIESSRFNIERVRELLAPDFQEFGQSGRFYQLANKGVVTHYPKSKR